MPESPTIADIYTVTPAEYASRIGIGLRSAQIYFNGAIKNKKLREHFFKKGKRVRMSKLYLAEMVGDHEEYASQFNTN